MPPYSSFLERTVLNTVNSDLSRAIALSLSFSLWQRSMTLLLLRAH